MKRLLYTLVVALAAFGCVSRSPKPAEVSNRTIEICGASRSDTLRLGRLHAGETVVQSVDVLNGCDTVAVINRIECGCACLSAEFDYAPVMPQQRRTMKITLDTRSLGGWVLRRVDIHAAGQTEPYKLWLEAEVE